MSLKLLIGIVLVCLSTTVKLETRLRFFQYCTLYNYPVEDHIIHTTDQYNLQYYRIQAKNSQIVSGKRVIYLQHGLVDSSDTWVVNDEHLAPAFYLANLGFDVWLGNSRGNRYSHESLSPKVKNFWNFTFDQMAQYDLPAAFRYISNKTGRGIHYIGHSQGTLIMFIALAQRYPGIEENLLSFHAFGPVVYIKNQLSPMFKILDKIDFAQGLRDSGVEYAFLLTEGDLVQTSKLCALAPPVCHSALKEISEMNNTVNNLKRLPVILGHFPSGSSVKNFVHFDQYVKHESFKKFDYGAKNNMKIYGQATAPVYNLTNIRFPVHLYVGKYDKLADVKDSATLYEQLSNSVGKTSKIYDYGHATFVWGKTLIHVDDALAVINKIDPKMPVNIEA